MEIRNWSDIFAEQQVKALQLRSENRRDRHAKLERILEWILKNRNRIHEVLFQDLGKSPEESDITEIYMLTSELRYAMEHLEVWIRPQKVQSPITLIGSSAFIVPEPKGVCLIIAPWNYPFSLIISPLIAAIAGGNTAFLKPSEFTPNVASLIKNMIEELFDLSEIAVVIGNVEVVKEILLLPFNHIFFTGSPVVGKLIMTAAAKNLSSVTLELGGKSPVIVSDCANIKDAARKIIWAKFINAGQTCIAPDYVLVHKDIQKELLQHLELEIKRMYDENGSGIKSSGNYSRIVDENHFNRLMELLEDVKSNGAHIALGGNSDRSQKFIEPTILINVPNCKLMEEEIFGPILPILTFSDANEVVNLINKKAKPLSMYIFAKTKSFSDILLEKTSAGGVCVNDCLVHYSHPGLPFGGINNSGIGKSHGHFGFEEFTQKKAVVKSRPGFSLSQILYPPHTKFSRMVINFLIKYF